MISMNVESFFPHEPPKKYAKADKCIYCGSVEGLNDEHVIPFGLGGRQIVPKASCKACSTVTSAFEGICLRTMLGPLRMLHDMPSYRKKSRPEKMSLKVKLTSKDDWSYIDIDRADYPFLVLFPYFEMPDLLSGKVTPNDSRGAKTKRLWIRGASPSQEAFKKHLDMLISKLRVYAVEPEAKVHTEEFCLMIAKIGHSYASGVLGRDNFEPFLTSFILERDLGNRAEFIGSREKDEATIPALHELHLGVKKPDLIFAKIRLFAKLGTPTYFVVVGRLSNPRLIEHAETTD